ncbi:MAG: 30S ribosomal protein S4 [Nanoarchaeota archaeon]|nr:30S ribosomal protein S4 [Nanoarchaeota archaeon]
MGSPRKQRKKFSKPSHPWQKERILAEQELLKEYGLNRKYEIWKMNSILKNFTTQAKNLVTVKNPQVGKERNQLLTKLFSLGLLGKDAKIGDVLSLTLKDVMERRLQTLVCRKNMASSFRQARQFIVHEHISLGDKTITAPSYLVLSDEENSISFAKNSVLSNASHPERTATKVKKTAKEAKEKQASAKKEEKRDLKEKAVEKDAKEESEKAIKKKTEKKESKPKKEAKAEEKTDKGSKKKVPTTHELKKQKEDKKKQENKPEVKK